MNPATTRRRAPAMSPEERRAMIVQAAVPLVTEYGGNVTTSQIARAAGIAEGTIFRAFADKDEVLHACFAEALRPDRLEAELAAISLDAPLTDRLAEAAGAYHAYFGRLGALFGAMQASGHAPERPADGTDCGPARHVHSSALAHLFHPEEDQLRLPAERLASMFVALLMQCGRDADTPDMPAVEDVIQVFLHGALVSTTHEGDPH
jgi:AcrR family transcriptional regulator